MSHKEINKRNICEKEKFLIKYNDWIFTDKYVFYLKRMKQMSYKEINKVEVYTGFNLSAILLNHHTNNLTLIKVKLTLSNNKCYTIKMSPEEKEYAEKMIEVIKCRNLDVEIANS